MQEGDTSVGNSQSNDQTVTSPTQTEEVNSLTQSVNALKTFNPKTLYQVDSYVDALDTYSTWRIAKIQQIKDDVALVNYDGWSSKWDETIKLGGSKIAPFKKVTPTYTGGAKTAVREFTFEDSKELIAKTIEQLNTLTASKLKVTDPNFITQFFRGKLYILIDSILSLSSPLKSSSDIKLVVELMEAFTEFFIEYLNALPPLLKEYIDGKAINQPLLYLVNEKIALVSCIPELFETMTKLLGGNSRIRLYQNNEFPLKTYGNFQAAKPKDKYNAGAQNQIINCINHFGSKGGFEKLLGLLKWEQKSPSDAKGKADTNDKESIYRFPLNQVKWILTLVTPVTPLLTSSFKDKLAVDLRNSFFERLEKLTTRDYKDNDNQILGLIRESLILFEELFGKEAFTMCEQAELDVTLSLLKSPFLERKIKALNEFKDFFDRADPQVDLKQLGDKRRFRYWTNDKLKSWIIQKKILEYVLGEQSHVELLKRSIPIMKFLANMNALTQDNLDLLWKGCNSTHEEYVRAVYDAIIELSAEISVENIDYLFTKIKEIPMENYNEPILDLITKFTLNGMKALSLSSPTSYFAKAIKRTPKYEFYGMKLLWECIQDGSPMKLEFTSTAFQSLTQIVKHQSFKSEKEKYLVACFENVKRGLSVPQSLLLSLFILMTYNSQSGIFGLNTTLDEIVNKFQKEYNLVNTVVNDFERYMKEVNSVHKGLEEKGNVPSDRQAHVFVGRYSHVQNIDHRLLFIENIALQLRKGDFGIDHLKNLWNVLVKKSVTEVERNCFLKWILKSKTSNNGKTKTYIFNDTLLKSFFSDILCDPTQTDNFKIYNPDIFNCFERCFEILNEKDENLEMFRNSPKVLRFQNLIGYDVLWNILLNCPNEKVLRDVKNLIVSLNLRIQYPDDKLPVWQGFIDTWVDSFQKSNKSSNPELLPNVISLLNLFIVLLDGKKYLNKDGPVTETINLVVADSKSDKMKKTLTLPLNGTFFLLRKRIAEEFSLQINEFDMYINPNIKITPEIEELYAVTTIEAHKDKDKDKDIIINVRPTLPGAVNHKDKFKALLINNQTIMDILFEFLGSKNSKIVNDIWELLSYLPFNKSIKSTLEKLPIESEKSWFKILDVTCTRKLLYCLKIVGDLAMNQSAAVSDQWNQNFIKKKGFDHLFKIFFKIEDTELSSVFNCKSSEALMRFINYFLVKYYKSLTIEPEKITEAFNKVLNGLALVTQNGFITDANDPHLQDDLKKPAQEFALAGFDLLRTCITLNSQLIKSIYEFPDLSRLIRNGLIESDDQSLRVNFAQSFVSLVQLMNQVEVPEGAQGANSFFLSFLLRDLLDYAFDHRDKCKEFFSAMEHIFKQCNEADIEAAKINFFDLANELAQKIKSLPPFETQQTDQDSLLQGLMSLLRLIFTKKPAIKDEILLKSQPELLHEILHNCLFEIPSAIVEKGVITGPKCKSKESRKIAFHLLQSMTTGINEVTIRAVEYLRKLVLNNFWRTQNNSDWYIVPINSEKSKVGYVGLENLGCTCYMNSLFQQLYMISDFRDTVLESEDINAGKVENHENLFHQIQLIFGALKLSQRQSYDPRLFCHAFKDYEGNPMNVLEQMDVDEFFNNIMDKLETSIKPTPNEGIIKRVFGGVMSNELICKGCPHYSEREEACLAFSLQVKNKKNVQESLQAFVQGEMLEGENAYYCERCDKKIPTLKRVCIKKLPNILILVLKRFDYDYETMQRFKINDYIEFPTDLNMLQYTQGYLKKKENQKDDQSGNEDAAGAETEYPPEYYQYTLRGTVIHMGTAESGHYYSFIKDNANNWFEFNDSIIKPFDVKDLAHEAFGGEEKINIENIGNAKEVKEKSRNAYLLFYEREAYFDENGNKVPTMLIGNHDREIRNKVDNMNSQILKETKEDNFKFHTTKYIWDRDYGDYVFRLVEQLSQRKDLGNPSQEILEAAKFCTLFFMTVILRGQERSRLPRFLRELKVLFRASTPLCLWYVECFSYPEIIKEFLIDCPVKDMKYFVLGLVKIALNNVYAEQKNLSVEEFEGTPTAKFVNSLVFVMHEQIAQVKLLDKLFDILAIFSGLGFLAKQYLNKKQVVGRLIYYMVPEKPPVELYRDYTEEFTNVQKAEISELGKPNTSSGVKANELVKSISEMISKKKEKLLMEQTSINFNPLVETVVNVAMAAQPFNTEEPSLQLGKEEKNLLLANINVPKLLLMHSSSKRARKIVSSFVASVSVKNEESGKEIFFLLEKELREKDDVMLKVYLQTLEKLMLVQDDYQKTRVENGMSILMNTIKDNSKFYKATEICLDYLFKLCSRNSWALRLCSENKAFVKFVEGWLRDYANPYQGFSAGNLKLFKKKQYKILKEEFLQNQSKFISKSQERLAKLKKVYKNDSEELAPEYDSDEDFSEHQYQIQEKIDYQLDNSNWVSAIVSDNLDEMIKLTLQNDQVVWIVYDCDRTGPHLRVQSHTKNNVDFYT